MNRAPWWLHLSNHSIPQLHLISGEPPLLAVFSRVDRVDYYHAHTGNHNADQSLSLSLPTVTDRSSLEWQNFVGSLRAPNGASLPVIRTAPVTVYTSRDGKTRVYHESGGVFYRSRGIGEREERLALAVQTRAVAVAHDTACVFALDERGQLCIDNATSHPLGLIPREDSPLHLEVSDDGALVFATDGRRIVSAGADGKPGRTVIVPAPVNLLACSADGRYVLTSDSDTGVLRVYDGATLRQIYQRFAIDLVASAHKIQLMADLPPVTASVSAIAINPEGQIALAMVGVVCLSSVEKMTKLPTLGVTV